MSGALLLSLAAALVALLGGLLGASAETARWWRAAAGALVVVVAAGVSWIAPRAAPADSTVSLAQAFDRAAWRPGAPVHAVARGPDGAPVATHVVLERGGARRQVRRVDLVQPVPGAPAALWAMLALGLVALVLPTAGRGGASAARLAAAGAFAAGAAALVLWSGARGAGEGAADLRAWLERMGAADLGLTGFTVPDGPWRFVPPGLVAIAVATGVAGVAALRAFTALRVPAAQAGLAAGAMLAAAAPLWRLLEVGGLPWRPVEGALWASALLLAGAWFDRASPARASLLAAVAAALPALAWG